MVTAGTGGPITGRGADLLILDDPIKNWQEASSVTIREHTWNWFQSTAYTRLEPGGSVVIVLTRWHDDDPAGKLLKRAAEGTGEQWDLLNLPAIAGVGDSIGRQPGEALWPWRYPLSELARIQGVQSPEIWSALYQGTPMLGAGLGRAYKGYSAANRQPTQFNPHLALSLCCDFNVDPMCWLLAQHDGNRAWVLEEIVLGDSRTAEAILVLAERVKGYIRQFKAMYPDRPMLVKLYGDSSGSGRTTAGDSDWAQIRLWFRGQADLRAEWDVPAGNPIVKDRVESVNAMFCNARGEHRLFVDPRCKELILDLERVTWKPQSIELDKKTDKRRTHTSDALGYMIHREYRIDGFQRQITKN